MIKTTIIYNHRGRFAKDKTAPVEVRLTIDRRVYYFHTGVCVRAREWRLGQIVNRQDSDVLNERVRIMLERVGELVNDAMRNGGDIDVEKIRQQLNVQKPKKIEAGEDMVGWMADELSRLGVRRGTFLHYKVSVSVLAESGIMRKWSDLSVENVHRWDAYLHSIKKHRTDAEIKAGKPEEFISQATVRNYHKDIKTLLGRALKFGLIAANPYDRMKGEIKRGNTDTVEFLTKEELGRIEAMTLIDGSMMAAARDMFVFQAYTGMAFSDMQAFALNKCRHEGDRWLMSGQRVKTGVTYYVQLLPQALAVAEKYGGELPKVAVQTYNKNLKKIADATGIRKRLTSHVARHTFATWALHVGVPIERVSKMLGHAKVTQTQRYAKVLAEDVFGEFENKLQ